eukprot:2929043-Rhodomonas_salina.1
MRARGLSRRAPIHGLQLGVGVHVQPCYGQHNREHHFDDRHIRPWAGRERAVCDAVARVA